jgi:hypothetical protein
MAEWHLKDIAAAFERKGWRCVAERSDDNFWIAAVWQMERVYDGAVMEIAFRGYDWETRTTHTIEQAYCCDLVGNHQRIQVYFYGHKHTPSRRAQWRRELEAFVAEAIAWATSRSVQV